MYWLFWIERRFGRISRKGLKKYINKLLLYLKIFNKNSISLFKIDTGLNGTNLSGGQK